MIYTVFVGTYVLISLVIGALAYRKVKTSEDFFIAGRNTGTFGLFTTVLATAMGGVFYGLISEVYLVGIAPAFWYILGLGGFGWLAGGLLWIKHFRRLGLRTVSEALGQFYDVRSQILCSVINIFASCLVTASQLLAGAAIVSAITGMPFQLAFFLAGTIILVCTTLGGMVAVIWADAFRAVFLYVSIVVASIISIYYVGGWDQFVSHPSVSTSDFNPLSLGILLPIGYIAANFLNGPSDQVGISRAYSARNEKSAQIAAVLGGSVFITSIGCAGALGLSSRIMFPGMDPMMAFPALVQQIFHPVLGAVMIVAAFSIVMSSADSTLQASSSLLTVDIYQRLINRNATDKQLLLCSRFMTLVAGGIALFIGSIYPHIVGLVIFAFGMRGAGLFLPIVLRFMKVYIHRDAAFWSALAGAVTEFVWLTIGQPFGLLVIPGLCVASIVLVIVNTIKKKDLQEASLSG